MKYMMLFELSYKIVKSYLSELASCLWFAAQISKKQNALFYSWVWFLNNCSWEFLLWEHLLLGAAVIIIKDVHHGQRDGKLIMLERWWLLLLLHLTEGGGLS
jgi:hypothetical protein